MLVVNVRDATHLELARRLGYTSHLCIPLMRGAGLWASSP